MKHAFDPFGLSVPLGHYIGGQYVSASEEISVIAPSNGGTFGAIPCACAEMVDRAVAAARSALYQSDWGHSVPRDRLRALRNWADLIEQEAETLARLEAVCSSRPVADVMAGDIPVTAEQIRFFAEFADKECDALAPTAEGHLGMIASEPYGVVGAITP